MRSRPNTERVSRPTRLPEVRSPHGTQIRKKRARVTASKMSANAFTFMSVIPREGFRRGPVGRTIARASARAASH
jgi:hypothetical protein